MNASEQLKILSDNKIKVYPVVHKQGGWFIQIDRDGKKINGTHIYHNNKTLLNALENARMYEINKLLK